MNPSKLACIYESMFTQSGFLGIIIIIQAQLSDGSRYKCILAFSFVSLTRCYEIDWKSRVLSVDELYVVLDKPAGISVGGTTDNIEESCVTFTSRALGLTVPLKTTHQIDNCTDGWYLF